MRIFDWLKRRGKKLQQTEDANSGRPGGSQTPPIAQVSYDYRPKTTSAVRHQYFRSEEETKAHIRKTFKFTDYMIEGIRVVGVDRKDNGYIYEVYNCDSRTTAMQFLRAIPQGEIPSLYYIIVETPTGNIGKDLDGMFDESTGSSIG